MTSEPHRRSIGSLRAVALDATDIDRWPVLRAARRWHASPATTDDWITLDTGDGWRMGRQRAIDHVPPDWPDQDRRQQGHLDIRVPDIDAAAERAQQLAPPCRAATSGGNAGRPAGHPFDLCLNPDDPRTT